MKLKDLLNEMAAKELNKVVDLIMSGRIDRAATKYIEYGRNPSPIGVSKTVNSFLSKHPDVYAKNFETFKSYVKEVAAKQKPKIVRDEDDDD